MRAYERLLNYVKVYTTSDPVSDTHPTTARQFDLARMLVKELQDLGLADAHVDEHCYVYATLPATPGHEAAKGLGFIAHMDTSPDAPGENVKPRSMKIMTAAMLSCPVPAQFSAPGSSHSWQSSRAKP